MDHFHRGVVVGTGLLIAASMVTGAFGFAAVLLAAVVFGAEAFRLWMSTREVERLAQVQRLEHETGAVAQLRKDFEQYRLDLKSQLANIRR